QPDPMLLGEQLQLAGAQPVEARIADMEQVRGGGLEYQRAEGADMAAVPVITVRAAPRLRMQPGVGRHQHALAGLLDRPGVRRAEVVFEEALHRRFAGDMADVAAADTVGDGQGDALAVLFFPRRQTHAVEVLVERFAALVGELADGDSETLPSPLMGEGPGERVSGLVHGLYPSPLASLPQGERGIRCKHLAWSRLKSSPASARCARGWCRGSGR